MTSARYRLRVATRADLDALRAVMAAAMETFLPQFYTPEQAAAAPEFMGLDTQLVEDGTYFIVEDEAGTAAGCGGWSRRATLFGGDASPGRDAALLDPATDAARVRAMYTHPDHARRGIGRMVLAACEAAARAEGFTRVELVATKPGEPLYRAWGFQPIEAFESVSSAGVRVPVTRMGKALGA